MSYFDRGVLPSAEHRSEFAAEATYGNANELLTALGNVTKTYRDGNSAYGHKLFETLLRITYAFKNEASRTLADKQKQLRAIVATEQQKTDDDGMFTFVNAQMCAVINTCLPGADLFEADVEPMADKKAALNARLLRDGLQVHDVSADGSCQFYALSYALTGSPAGADELRQAACDEIGANFDRYGVWFTDQMPPKALYLEQMRKLEEWGDGITLAAVANIHARPIKVLSAEGDMEIPTTTGEPAGPPITIGYYPDLHYVGIDKIPTAFPLSFFDQLDDVSQAFVQDGQGIVLLPDASLYNKAAFLEHAMLLLHQCIQTTRSQAKPGWEKPDWRTYYHELERVPTATIFYDGLMRMEKDDIFFKPDPNPMKIMFVHVRTLWHFANAAPMRPKLDTIPPELLGLITQRLDAKDLGSVNAATKTLQKETTGQLQEPKSAMRAFADHMQKEDKTNKEQLQTFAVLINRLKSADRNVNGMETSKSINHMRTKIINAVTAAYNASANKAALCITVLKAVYACGRNVTVSRIHGHIIEVSMELETNPTWEPFLEESHARFCIEYEPAGSLAFFRALNVYPFNGNTGLTLQNNGMLPIQPFKRLGRDNAALMEIFKDPSQATVAELIHWPVSSGSTKSRMRSENKQTIATLADLIAYSGLFSDAGAKAYCRAGFTAPK